MTAAPRSGSPPRLIGGVAMVAMWAALLARTLSLADPGEGPWYIAGFAIFLGIELIVWSWRSLPAPLTHVAFAVQAAVVLLLLDIDPARDSDRDFVSTLFVLQCYQAAVVFTGLPRAIWVATPVALLGASLCQQFGLVEGLALGLVPMAGGVVLAMFVVVTRELDAERAASERIVADLRSAQERLEDYAGQADELAALEQRARVAGDLEESVALTLATAREVAAAARERLEEPEQAAPELERLQELATEALAQMRRVITELRPSQG